MKKLSEEEKIRRQLPPFADKISHEKWLDYIVRLCDFPGKKVLEIGSRNVTGGITKSKFQHAEYIGMDIYPGENVDIVGDAHLLSTYFKENEKFDLIFSGAVFEHLAMPWRVAEEIRKLLKTGGYVFIETHYSFSSHERPWHFFQFSDMGLKVLFSREMGFETIEAGVSNPIDGVFAEGASKYLRGKPVPYLYCHSEYLGQKVREVDNFDWNCIDMSKLVEGTSYPAGEQGDS